MKTVILQEIIDSRGIVLGYLYMSLDLPFVPTSDISLQLEDGYTCMPVHVVYDVADSITYVIDIVQALFLGNCPLRTFLDEYLERGWRFREDIYPDLETMRIKI